MAGTIIKVGDKYRLQYQYDGTRYSRTISTNSKTEASNQLALFIAEVQNGSCFINNNLTFVELAQMFLDKYGKDNLSDTTYRTYKSQLNNYILQEFGRMKINKIKRLHVQEFANKLVVEYNLSSKTAKNYIKTISSILNKGYEWELLPNNVADKISIPKNLEKPRKKVILYSYDELNLFVSSLEKLEDKELQMAIYTSLNTGARRGEVLALTFNDINFDRYSIDFNKSKINIAGGTKIKDIKTGNNRQFYVSKNYIDKVTEYYHYLGSPDMSSPLFKMHPDTYTKHFKSFLADSGLRIIQLKDLRALNESILVNQGLDIVNVAKRLGHLPSTATNYYLDQIPEEDKKASEILQDLF